jgi:GNAT superfamily N-acetyltransferase
MRTVLIRAKTEADTAGCVDLLSQVHRRDRYPLHLPPTGLADFLAGRHEVAGWVAEQDGRIAGHVALHYPRESPTLAVAGDATGLPVDGLALVSRLFVAPAARRNGLGRVLLRHATDQAQAFGRRAVLDVRRELTAAVALYESEGWHRAGGLHRPLALWVYVSPGAPDLRLV